MIILLIVVHLFYKFYSSTPTVALPLLSESADHTTTVRDTSTITSIPFTCTNERTIWDIVWGCLVTLFVCAWVSVHPNIPALNEKWWKVALRCAELMIWTLVMPELVIGWALRQWIGARHIEKEQKNTGWTMTHGHFIQMGGFMLCDQKNKKLYTLSYRRYKRLLVQNRINPPTITQEDIEDRSKSDGLAKLVVLGQTGWFVAQCIVRWIQKYEVTGMEVATLAFALLNGCMYFCWWYKPLDVRVPVNITLKSRDTQRSDPVNITAAKPREPDLWFAPELETDISSNSTSSTSPVDAANPGKVHLVGPRDASTDSIPSEHSNSLAIAAARLDTSDLRRELPQGAQQVAVSSAGPIIEFIRWDARFPKAGIIINIRTDTRKHRGTESPASYESLGAWNKVLVSPIIIPLIIFRRIHSLAGHENHILILYDGEFAAPSRESSFNALVDFDFSRLSFSTLYLIGAAFGAVHCLAWSNTFPTRIEQWLWKGSSAFIAFAPILMAVSGWDHVAYSKILDSSESTVGTRTLVLLSYLVCFIFYITLRFFLLTLPLTTLRRLPPSAYEVVDWTTFMPHI